jgi:hypothetical protein
MTHSLETTRRLTSFTGLLAFGAIQCCLAAPAYAEGDDPAAVDTAAARALAVDGMKLAQIGRCEDAISKLERAQKLHPAPVILEQLGQCNVSIGRIVEGTEMLRKVLLDPLPAHASPVISKAYERAQATLEVALPKIASLTISVNAPADAKVSVEVDGQPVPSALIGAARPTNPGDRLVEATAPGYLKASAKVTLGSGARRSIALELERDPAAKVLAPLPAESAENGMAPSAASSPPGEGARTPVTEYAPAMTSTPAPSPPNHVPAYVAWAVGGAGLAVGATFGVLAMNGKSDLEADCKGTVCPATSQAKLDSAKRDGTIATVGFGVGAAGLVLGTVLYFTAGSGGTDNAIRASGHSPRHATHRYGPRAWLGVSGVSFATDF